MISPNPHRISKFVQQHGVTTLGETARILLVEPDDARRAALETALRAVAHVESHGTFKSAHARLIVAPFEFLMTNVRLGAYNGLHLVYLTLGQPTRTIVYSGVQDVALAREAQRAGAFFELTTHAPIALPGYVHAVLPEHDRRDPASSDRRGTFRGGRRRWDRFLVQ